MNKVIDVLSKLKVMLDRNQIRKSVLLLICIVVSSVLETIGVSAILPLVKIVVSPAIIENNKYLVFVGEIFNLNKVNDYILISCLFLALIYVIKNIFLLLINRFQQKFIYETQRDVACRLMKNYLGRNYLYFTTRNVADLQRDIFTDVAQSFAMIDGILNLLAELFVCAFILFFLIRQDWLTTLLIAIILVVVMLAITGKLKSRLNYMGVEFRKASAQINKWIIQTFSGIKDVKAHNRETYFYGEFRQSMSDYALLRGNEAFLRYLPKPIIETIVVSALLGIISIRIMFGAEVEKLIPVLSIFTVAAIRMLPSVNRIGNSINVISYNYPFFNATYETVCLLPEASKSQEEDRRINIATGISINNISFGYSSKPGDRILSNIYLEIPKNVSLALVGPSGSGKTTFADIILGLINPSEGTVCVDGVDIRDMIDTWHNSIGYIPQNVYLLDDTIRSNVAFGLKEEEIIDDKVWDALRKAQADGFVRELKEGIYSTIGDRGIQLSGGQRQRLGIARALYRNPELLVLDEATSALDNETESAVMDAIYNLNGTVTMIVIAHRLSTVLNCNYIYEVKNGQIYKKTKEELVKVIEEKS